MEKQKSRLQSYLEWCCEKFLSYRPRTENEVRQYLRKKLIQKKVSDTSVQSTYIEPIIKNLYEKEVLNDKKFIDWLVSERQYFKPKGKRGLEYELRQKGISPELISEFFSHTIIEEPKHIADILNKKYFNYDFSDRKKHQKAIAFFQRRGFSFEHIKKAIEDFTNSE